MRVHCSFESFSSFIMCNINKTDTITNQDLITNIEFTFIMKFIDNNRMTIFFSPLFFSLSLSYHSYKLLLLQLFWILLFLVQEAYLFLLLLLTSVVHSIVKIKTIIHQECLHPIKGTDFRYCVELYLPSFQYILTKLHVHKIILY